MAFLAAATPCLALTADQAGALARRIDAGEAAARVALLDSVARRDAEAEFTLAKLVFEGRGFARDAGQARRLAERAAGRGHAGAQNMLGFFWQHGLGGARDAIEARRWYEQAANAGDPDAQVNLGCSTSSVSASIATRRSRRSGTKRRPPADPVRPWSISAR